MGTNELLVRTMIAAKEARQQGFEKTADAFEKIAKNLLTIENTQAQFSAEPRANSRADVSQVH